MRNASKSKRGLFLVAIGTILLGIVLVSLVQAQKPVLPTPPPPPPLPTLTPQSIPGMPIPTSTPNILVEPQVKVGPPEFTPTPYINTVDLAPKMSMKDKVEIWILTADGEKKRFIAPPEVRPESLLESGDTLLVVVPPASSRRVPPGPPTSYQACDKADVTFPFALGNTWIYSGSIYAGFNPTEIFTATYVVTESVAALHSHPPYSVVQIHREQVPSPIPAEDDYWSAEKLTATEDYWYAVEDRTVYRLREEPDWDAIATSVTTGTTEIAFVFPLEAGKRWYLNEKMRELYPGFETDSMLRQVIGQGAVETPTETFEQCFQMTEVIGGDTFETWFCPGVGIVARKADHSGTPLGMHELLMGYKLDGSTRTPD